MKIFFTGVTGFIGQFLAVELLRRGHEIIFLARGKNGVVAEDRVADALALVDPGVLGDFRDKFSVIEGDLGSRFSDVDADAIMHIAGNTSFAEGSRADIMSDNVEGTRDIIGFADRNGISEVHYMGAAYSNDFTSGRIVEENCLCIDQENFVNPYAESKCKGKMVVVQWGKQKGKRAFVYEPSIVAGHSKSGLTTSFTGYYRFMQAFVMLKNVAMKRNGGDYNIPIHVPGVKGATINIVTIDYVVEMVSRLIDCGVPGIYHITNSNPPEFEYLLQEGLGVIGISGPSTNNNPSKTKIKHRPVQMMVKRGLKDYRPFISYNTKFSQEEVKKVLGSDFKEHPKVDQDLVKILLGFAIENGFSRKRVYKTAHLRNFDPRLVPGICSVAT